MIENPGFEDETDFGGFGEKRESVTSRKSAVSQSEIKIRVIHGVIGFFWLMAQKMWNLILIQEKAVIFDIGHVIAWEKSKIWDFLTMFLGFRLYKFC